MIEYYKILGLSENASMEDIISSYTRLAIKNNPSNGGTHYLFNIIHYAYNEIVNNYNNKELNKEYLLLENFEIKSNIDKSDNIIDAEIVDDSNKINSTIFIPKPNEICDEVYNIFKYFDTNPFIKDNNYDLKKIISRFNELQLKKKNNKLLKNINSDELFIRKNIFKKVDILSKVGPSIDLALYICDLYNYNVNNNESRGKIRILLIKSAAKDIIAKNGGMILNDDE